jgi:hypothetical protein
MTLLVRIVANDKVYLASDSQINTEYGSAKTISVDGMKTTSHTKKMYINNEKSAVILSSGYLGNL